MGKNIIKAGFLAVLILSAGAVQAGDSNFRWRLLLVR